MHRGIVLTEVLPLFMARWVVPRVDSGPWTHPRPGKRRRRFEVDPLDGTNVRKDSTRSMTSLNTPLLSDQPQSPRQIHFPKDVKVCVNISERTVPVLIFARSGPQALVCLTLSATSLPIYRRCLPLCFVPAPALSLQAVLPSFARKAASPVAVTTDR